MLEDTTSQAWTNQMVFHFTGWTNQMVFQYTACTNQLVFQYSGCTNQIMFQYTGCTNQMLFTPQAVLISWCSTIVRLYVLSSVCAEF